MKRRVAVLKLAGLLAVLPLIVAGCDKLSGKPKAKEVEATAATAPAGGPAVGGAVAAVPPQDRVATINQAGISTTDLEMATLELRRFVEANQQAWQPLSTDESPEQLDLHDVLDNLVDVELRAQDAKARGLDAKPDVKRRLAYVLRGFYAQEWDRWQRERAMPTEEDIRKFYEENKAGFTEPEQIRTRQIVTDTLSEAEAVRTKAVSGEDFAQLARNFSVGAGKEQGGEIGWQLRTFDRDRLRYMGVESQQSVFFPQLEPVAFALEISQISQPVKGPDTRYYVIKLEERKPAKQQTELEVHDSIRGLLLVQNIQKQMDELRKKAQIEKFSEKLKDVKQ